MSRDLKILLIEPSRYVSDGKLLKTKQLLFPSLAFPILAALTPESDEVRIVSEVYEDVDFDASVDLVGLTAYTSYNLRAYDIAAEFRRRGVHTVMGGVHASMVPDEAAGHVDTVFVGEAEETWPQFLEDFRAGHPKDRYTAPRHPPLDRMPIPKLSLLDWSRYACLRTDGFHRFMPLPLVPVQTARGCPHGCEYCTVTAFHGGRYRHRPIPAVVEEVRTHGARGCFFVDDNIFAVRRRAMALFEALRPLGIAWIGQGTMAAADDPELLAAARASGCVMILVGMESISSEALASVGKTHNVVERYERQFAAYREAEIAVFASVMFGLDGETPGIFEETCDFLIANRVTYTMWWPVIPLPGTRYLEKLREAGRLKHDAWWLGDESLTSLLSLKHRLKGMSEETFWRKFEHAYKRFYSFPGITRRMLMPPPKRLVAQLLMNLLLRSRLQRGLLILET